VEGYNFDIRKHVLEYDNVVNTQREVIYNQRRQILSEPTMRPTIMGMVEDELRALAEQFTGHLAQENWDLAGLAAEVNKIFPLPKEEKPGNWRRFAASELADHLVALAEQTYDAKEKALGAEQMRHLEKLVMLRAVDNRWVRHLTDLDELREGIGLRAIAQQDPLIAYKKEAHEMYQELVAAITHDIVGAIYHAQLMVRPAPPPRIYTSRGDGSGAQPARRAASRTGPGGAKELGRNDPCWCGSGKKYKHCHMREDQGRGSDGSATAKAQTRATAVPAPGGKPPAKRQPARRR
jgi:preprotein translocase subunit SecA